VVVAGADDQIPGAGGGPAGDPHSGATVHDAEVKQVVTDAQGQFLAAGMVGGYQQRVLACCPTSVMKPPTPSGCLHSGKAPRGHETWALLYA